PMMPAPEHPTIVFAWMAPRWLATARAIGGDANTTARAIAGICSRTAATASARAAPASLRSEIAEAHRIRRRYHDSGGFTFTPMGEYFACIFTQEGEYSRRAARHHADGARGPDSPRDPAAARARSGEGHRGREAVPDLAQLGVQAHPRARARAPRQAPRVGPR